VSLGNIVEAYNSANSGGLLKEFCYSEEEVKRAEQFGQLAGKLHTAMHEVIGHASGQMNKGVTKDNLGQYGSTLEEARADLVALYYLMDQKLVDLGVMPSLEVGKAEYDEYIRNGMMVQLRRLRPGESIEEDHMRNRQMVAQWVYEAGKEKGIIEQKMRDNKTYYVINDYEQLRQLFGELLKQIQTIKSTGNEAEGKKMVEQFGVKVNANLHTEVLKRSKALDIAAYRGFIQPKLSPVYTNGQLTDVTIDYNESFIDQMLRYSKDYHFLPLEN
jgi:dipeptidyl-peptidase-3